MIKSWKFAAEILIIILIHTASAFSMGNKTLPMKTYTGTEITEAEFLHYCQYFGGERDSDYYYVTRTETNGKGGLYYRVYYITIPVSEGKKPPENYSNWPSFFVIDPKTGSIIESEFKLNPNDSIKWAKGGLGYLIYGHYKLFHDKGYVEYFSKKKTDYGTNETRYIVRFNTDIPSGDVSGVYFQPRFLDPLNTGVYYKIIPEFMKDAMPVTMKFLSKETIKVKAGTFRVNKYSIVMADPFVGKLVESVMKNSIIMIEVSERRLVVKSDIPGGYVELEEISNINKR